MSILKRYSGMMEVDGRILQMDFTLETIPATWDDPAQIEMYDAMYYLDGVAVAEEDLSDEMQEKTYVLAATAKPIPYNFGPPDDYGDSE